VAAVRFAKVSQSMALTDMRALYDDVYMFIDGFCEEL
jgi:hypothetical protein